MGAGSSGGGWRVDIVGPKKKSLQGKDKDRQKALPSSSSTSSSASGAIAWLNDIEVNHAPNACSSTFFVSANHNTKKKAFNCFGCPLSASSVSCVKGKRKEAFW